MKRLLSGLLLVLATLPLSAQSDRVAEARKHYAAAVNAYKANDYASYLTEIRQASELRPGHQTLLFNLAGALALNRKSAESIAALKRLAAMGVDVPIEKEKDLDAVRALPEFASVAAAFQRNRAPVNNATVARTFSGKGLVTEGIAIDPKSGTFFVSSVREGKILAIDSKGTVSTFADSQSGLWAVLGMTVDPKRRILWAVSAAMPQMKDFDPATDGSSALLAFDVDSRRLLKRIVVAPTPDAKHSFGDLTIDAAGTVYVSDSGKPVVYLLRNGGSTFEVLTADPAFVNLQGLALDGKRKLLYIADYSVGIWALDLASKRLRLLESPPDATLLGIDGLYFDRGALVAVQNGVRPHRVVRLTLDRAAAKVTKVDVLEANHPLFDEPTLGAIDRGTFYFIANSQWGAFDEKNNLPDVAAMKDPVILQLKLK